MTTEALYAIYLQHSQVTTDSRKVPAGSLYFALRGERFDGNDFAADALDKGAAYAVVDREETAVDDRYILVPDTLRCLQDLARHHRRQSLVPIIGITGSNGKTTTKELVSAVMGSHYRIHYTQGNYNNHIGVPLTLLAMPIDTEAAIIEMGANHQGEIDFLCHIAEPSHGLITNIGKAHLEGFGGIEGVKKGKSELYRFLAKAGGIAFINKDADFLRDLAAPVEQKIFYGGSEAPSIEESDIEIKLLGEEPFLRVAFLDRDANELITIQSQLYGTYNFANIATAIALGKYFKVPSSNIQSAIAGYAPTNNRSQILEYQGNTFLMDAYNANPTSMSAALTAFSAMSAPRKVAIIGDMLELGEESEQEHLHIAQLANAQQYDELILVGSAFEQPAKALQLLHFPDVVALSNWFREQHYKGVHFLIKASRGIQLEKLLS